MAATTVSSSPSRSVPWTFHVPFFYGTHERACTKALRRSLLRTPRSCMRRRACSDTTYLPANAYPRTRSSASLGDTPRSFARLALMSSRELPNGRGLSTCERPHTAWPIRLALEPAAPAGLLPWGTLASRKRPSQLRSTATRSRRLGSADAPPAVRGVNAASTSAAPPCLRAAPR
jgi:hypothetical protein